MFTKLASAALVTFALTGTAMAGETDGAVLRFEADAAATAAGRSAMLDDIARAARDVCSRTGTHIRDAACEHAFTTSAIDSIKRPELRAELRQDYSGAAGPEVTVAQAPGG